MTIHARKALAAGCLMAASLGFSGLAHAQTYAEPTTDAGQTLADAAVTAGPSDTSPLTTITGSFNAATDADLYVIKISSPGTFSATTVNTASSGVDTALFLFAIDGSPIATNDDAPGGASTDSTLPAGDTLYANVTAGTYYLGISQSGNEPINANAVLLFAAIPGGDSTAIRGPAANLSPAAESTFNGLDYSGTTGDYEIDLTGVEYDTAAVPEPATWTGLLLGAFAAGFTLLLRRRQKRAA